MANKKAAENEVINEEKINEEEMIEEHGEGQAAEPVEEVIVRPYTLRKLKDGDLFPLLQIFRKIGLKEFKDAFSQMSEGKSVREVGVSVVLEMASIVIGNIPVVEDDIYSLCASLSGNSVEEIKDMEFGTVPLVIYDSFSEVKNTSFFKVLSKLL